MMKQEENSRAQKEEHQDKKMNEMAMSATEQIQRQVDKSLEPKLEVLLAKKVRTYALKTKSNKQEQHYKLKSNSSNTREQIAKKETLSWDHSVDTECTLAKFSKQNYGVELSNEEQCKNDSQPDSDEDNKKHSGKGKVTPSGKGRYEVIANLVLNLTMIVMV